MLRVCFVCSGNCTDKRSEFPGICVPNRNRYNVFRSVKGTGIFTKIINWTSDRSYTLYLIHATVFATFQQFYAMGKINKLSYVLASIVLALVFTELVYRYVEVPANRLAKKITLKAQRS